MNADDLTRIWAARRLDVPVEKIESVEFVDEPECRYSSWTIEPATQGANVHFTEPHDFGIGYGPETWKWIDTTGETFGDLLAELVGS